MPSQTLKIKPENPLHKKLLDKLSQRIKWSERVQTDVHEEWRKTEETMLAFMPESEADARRRTRRDNDGDPQYTTIVLPYSYAVTLSAHTYLSSVILGRNPVHQYAARHGETQMQVMALEAIVDYQTQVGANVVPYYSWLYDGCRYGQGIVRTAWEREVRHVVSIPPELMDPEADFLGQPAKGAVGITVEEVELYEGNKVVNINPFNFLPDPRVSFHDFQKGEFVAVRLDNIGWNHLKRQEALGYYTNLDRIKTSHGTSSRYGYQGSSQETRPQNQYFEADGEYEGGIQHPAAVNLYEEYVELIPSEWGIGNRDYPEKWCFTFTQDFSILIGATPMGNYHCAFPFDIITLDPDAYTNFKRGMPKILEGVQHTMDWLINTHFFNVRAALQNLFIVDPSRVNITDLEDPLPGGIIRVREEALGNDVRTAIHQVQIADITQAHVGDLGLMQSIGERLIGVNDSLQGASGGADRKTATEVRTSTSYAVNRLKTIVEFMSALGIGPHSQKIVTNTQQFMSTDKKIAIAGDTLLGGERFLDVNPKLIQGFYNFVPVDGTMPVDRLAEAKLIQELITQLVNFPQLALEYDLGKMVAWGMQRAGMKNIHQFKIQLTPDQKVAAQLQAGNLLPMGPPGVGAGRTSASRGPNVGNGAGASGAIV